MLTAELIEEYKKEDVAVAAFKEYRLRNGVICKKCGSPEHYWLSAKQQFQCKLCRFRTTLRSGSVLEGSKLPISYYFIALHLLIKHGNKLRVDDFQLASGHKYYEPLWDFLTRIKAFINKNERREVLLDFFEIINEHFATEEYKAKGFNEDEIEYMI